MTHSLQEIEAELKKRTRYKYNWGRMQNDAYDRLTQFIYSTKAFDDVIDEVKKRFAGREDLKEIGRYAVNRWYNFKSAQAVESIFYSHQAVQPAEHSKDRYCDFSIHGIPFDLKTTVFPQSARISFEEATADPQKLALWFYRHQSSEQRQHYHNRLFIVLHKTSDTSLSWTLKSDLSMLEPLIKNYLDNFDAAKLMELELNEHRFKTDIIWGITT